MLKNNLILSFLFKDVLIKDIGEESNARTVLMPTIPRFHYIIHFIVDGKGTYFNANSMLTGKTLIRKNQAFGIFKNDSINYLADHDNPFYYYWVGFDGEEADRIMRYVGFTEESPVININDPKKIVSAFKALISAGKKQDMYRTTFAFLNLIIALHDNNESKSGNVLFAKENYILKQAEDYITQHISENITIAGIAKDINVSREHFSRLFKEKYNISPHKYILRLKLKQAETMLLSSDASISQIANALNFSDIYAFSRAFKTCYKISPSQFRKAKT